MSSTWLSRVSAAALGVLGVFFLWYSSRAYDAPVSGEGMEFIWVIFFVFYLVSGLTILSVAAYGYQRNRPDITTGLLVGILILIGTFHFHMYHWSPNTQLVVTVGLLISAIPAIATGLLIRQFIPHTNPET